MALPTDKKARKAIPLYTGLLAMFPDAMAEIAHCSYVGNLQHFQDGATMKWDRKASADHRDALVRHLMEAGTVDEDGVRHAAKLAWRALALLQTEIEDDRRREPHPPQGIGGSHTD